MSSVNNEGASPENLIDPQIAFRIKDIGRLVSLPQTTYHLMTLLADENTSAKDLQHVVELDPALSAKVISLSNSSYYSLRAPVSTIERAITIIGFKELGFMAMGLGLSETFDLSRVPAGFDGETLWLHCLAVSWISRELAVLSKVVEPSEAMVAGLLHDLGIILLVSKFTVQFQDVLDMTQAGLSFFEAETSLGLAHSAVGYFLAKNWGLPPAFQECILYHHCPDKAAEFVKITSLVALADNLALKVGYDNNLEGQTIDLSKILEALSLKVETLQAFVKTLKASLADIEPFWLQMIKSGAHRPSKQEPKFSILNLNH